jgi:ParB family chromosome partitioning protein
MKVEISKIQVANRIRKEIAHIDELAADIRQNGLLNPVTVMQDGGELRLLAGLRRLRAAQALGWTEIEVNEVAPKDAEAALRIEFSENVQREEFNFSEKADYGRLLEEIVKAKARERMMAGKKADDPKLHGSEGKGQTRDIVGPKVGMSGPQYERARYVADHAPPEVIEQLDAGKKSISGAYRELRAAKKPPAAPPPPPKQPAPRSVKIADYQEVRAERDNFVGKYAEASHKREMLETQLHNVNLQWQCEREGKDETIERQRRRIAELEAELAAANARIAELEAAHEE